MKVKINMNKEMIVREGHLDERERRRWCLEIEYYRSEIVRKECEREKLEIEIALFLS